MPKALAQEIDYRAFNNINWRLTGLEEHGGLAA